MISSSPERHTFQAENYVKRCEEEGKEPSEDYLNLYKSARQQDEENMADLEWQKNNMEYDLRSTDWILEKVRNSRVYSQNLYAAMCNRDFRKLDVIELLKESSWSCSWRYAGGIVADMRQQGDYIDWYCSGIRNDDEATPEELSNWTLEQQNFYKEGISFVAESVVTPEIKEDLKRLGWLVIDFSDDDNF